VWRLFPLWVVGCSNVLEAPGLGIDVDAYTQPYLHADRVDIDSDSDGTADASLRRVALLLADRDDLCELGQPFRDISDVRAVQVLTLDVGGFDTLRTNASLQTMQAAPVAGDTFIGLRVTERRSGQAVLDAATQNFIDPSFVGISEMFVLQRDLEDGITTQMRAVFEATVVGDFAEADAYDTDWDTDGELDYRAIEVLVDGEVIRARQCPSLDLLP